MTESSNSTQQHFWVTIRLINLFNDCGLLKVLKRVFDGRNFNIIDSHGRITTDAGQTKQLA